VRDRTWYGGDMESQLTQGHRLGMWLPVKLILGHPLEHPPRRGCFVFQLLQQLTHGYHVELLCLAATTAVPSAITAQIAALSCIPWVNASRAGPSRAAPTCSGSRSATANAPPSVPRAALAASGGTPGGMALATRLRYRVVPMLPRIAMPSAPPSSELV